MHGRKGRGERGGRKERFAREGRGKGSQAGQAGFHPKFLCLEYKTSAHLPNEQKLG